MKASLLFLALILTFMPGMVAAQTQEQASWTLKPGFGLVKLFPGQTVYGEPGYTLMAGFAVKAFQFGVRYTSFSDLTNLGVVLGLRFSTFTID